MKCEKCQNGLLPFVKNGKVIPNAWVHCSCREDDLHVYPISPEDFDFPISQGFYQLLCAENGWPREPEEGMTHIPEQVNIPPDLNDELSRVKAAYIHLQGKLIEHIEKSKQARAKRLSDSY